MTYLLNFFTETNWTTVLYAINMIIAFAIIFLERRNPTAALAWVLVLFFIPIVGLLFYVIFAQNISKKKIFKLSDSEKRVISGSLKEQATAVKDGNFPFANQVAKKWKHMILLNQVYGASYLTQNNRIEIYSDGKKMFEKLLRDLNHANYSINVMYYIIKDDKVGKKFIEVLTQKAKEGVEVRLLMDALGCRAMSDRKLKGFIKAGGKVAYFFKPRFKYLNLKLNYRNHRKIVVIDGKEGFIGGFNIANEYLGFKRKFGYWRDTHIRIKGGAVQDLNARFILDWRFASKEKIELSEVLFNPANDEGNSPVQIVSCGPNSQREEIKRGMMKMITYAESKVYLQTPYFIPDPSMLESLKMAAQSGVDVRIMIPCMPDHFFVYWATYAYCGELIRSGAKVYIYDSGFLHAKTMVVDGEVATVGSANFDRRSFRLNFEANAFIYDEKIAEEMEELFIEDMKNGHELTLDGYKHRSFWIRFKEAISRLLSDLL